MSSSRPARTDRAESRRTQSRQGGCHMTTTAAADVARAPAEVIFFERFAGLCGIGAGVVGFLYALAFVVLRNQRLSALFLMLGGLAATTVLVALYERLRQTSAPLALWALLLGTV